MPRKKQSKSDTKKPDGCGRYMLRKEMTHIAVITESIDFHFFVEN